MEKRQHIIQVEDFRGYYVRCDTNGCRYYPVYQDDNGNWVNYLNGGKVYLYFDSEEAVINFFNS